VHSSREIATYREAEAGSFGVAGETSTHLNERLEYGREGFVRDSDTSVCHIHPDMVIRGFRSQSNLAAMLSELHRVREEIEENLLES
jgi:hypothetical protein